MVTSLSGRMFQATVRWAVFYTSSSASQSLRLSSARDLNARSTISLDDSSTADSISSSIHSRSLISLIGNSQLQVESHSLISTLIVYHPIRSLSSFFSSFFLRWHGSQDSLMGAVRLPYGSIRSIEPRKTMNVAFLCDPRVQCEALMSAVLSHV